MNDLFAIALEVQTFLEAQRWRFCFIGGVTVQRWGQPRFTQDVDLTLITGFGDEEKFIAPLLARFKARRPDALEFALRNRVLLVETVQGVDLDIALGGLPFEVRSVERASPFPIGPHAALLTCSAEDLIVHKSFAGRDRDWADVESVLERQRGKLDFPQIYEELTPLAELKEQPGIVDRLRDLVRKVERPR